MTKMMIYIFKLGKRKMNGSSNIASMKKTSMVKNCPLFRNSSKLCMYVCNVHFSFLYLKVKC